MALLVLLAVIGLVSSAWSQTPSKTVWRMQVIHTTAQSNFAQNVETAKEILEASGGRLEIKVAPNGTFASSLEAFQACGDGVFEMNSSWPLYAKGVEYALLPLTQQALGLDPMDKWVWLYEFGGWDIFQKAFDKMNLKLLAVEVWGTEILMANKPYKSIAEMKGKKFRTSDARLLAKNGIAGISLPMEEVFTGLQAGTVDMCEWGNLSYNMGIGLTDIAKYGIFPDFWNVHNVTTVVANKKAYDKLSPDLKKIVELGFKANEHGHWRKSQYLSAVGMRNLSEAKKMQFSRMGKEQFVNLRKQMYEIEQEDIKKYGALTAETYKSIYKFMEVWYPYKSLGAWWGEGLTPEQQMGFTPSK